MKAVPIIKKVLIALLTALFVSFVTFGLLYLSPGDPAELLIMDKLGGTGLQKDVIQKYAEILGTNQGFFAMYKNWFVAMLHGDLGTSYKTGYPVLQEFALRIGCSVKLALFSGLISLVLGVGLGILSARGRNKLIDKATRIFSSFSLSVPSFWLGILDPQYISRSCS